MRSQGPEADPGVAGGGGDGVSGKGEVGAQIRLGQRYRLSERIRQSPEAYAEFGNDTAEAARVRDTEEQFESRLLPLFVNRTRSNVYPQAAEQRCWNHKIVNVLAKLPKRQQDQAKLMLRTIPYAPTRTEAERLRTVFTRWCGDHSYDAASEALERDWDRMVTFYDFPKEHWGAPSHEEPGRITLRGPQASDRCRQALQEGRSGDSGDLENVDGRRTALQASEGP